MRWRRTRLTRSFASARTTRVPVCSLHRAPRDSNLQTNYTAQEQPRTASRSRSTTTPRHQTTTRPSAPSGSTRPRCALPLQLEAHALAAPLQLVQHVLHRPLPRPQSTSTSPLLPQSARPSTCNSKPLNPHQHPISHLNPLNSP